MGARLRTAVVGACVVVLMLAAPPAHASFPGANGKIAFVRDNDVWTMNPDGSNQLDITNTPTASEDSPAWSADGKRIAYERDRAIWTMNADGTLQTQLVAVPTTFGCNPFPSDALGGPAWSPDGSKIVFQKFTCTRDPDGHEIPASDLYTVNPDGTGQALLKREGMGPRWSPDGTKIGYTSFCYGGGCTSVRWITADGSSEFTVYQSNLDNDNFVDWSPDGLLLAGVGERPCAPCFESYTIHPDGTGYTVRQNGVGKWSPDGTKFVLGGVYVQNVDGSNRTQIASSGSSPDWQPIPYTGYPRPKGATPFQTYLVPAYRQCLVPTRTHGSPLAFPSCNPPVQASSFLTVGTPDANGQGAKSRGLVFINLRPETPSTPPDLVTTISVTDVRNKADLSDYTGELQQNATWRITDRYNSPSLNEPATVLDIPGPPVNVPCVATADTTIGSDCEIRTTANSVVPGMVHANKRMVVELGQVTVNDGGPDGNPNSLDGNTLFMVQGVFVP